MIAGPAALGVALLLLPGWVYWRLEARPRTSRTALVEFFEIVAAGTLATVVAVLVYVSVPGRVDNYRIGDRLAVPADLTGAYVREEFTRTVWSVALVVAFACSLAATAAWTQRTYRRRGPQHQSKYFPQTPIWESILGDTDRILALDLRDGRQITGRLGGHSVDDDGCPTVYLTPPLSVQGSAKQRRFFGPEPKPDEFPDHAVAVPGAEIVAVWREYGDEDM